MTADDDLDPILDPIGPIMHAVIPGQPRAVAHVSVALAVFPMTCRAMQDPAPVNRAGVPGL